MGEHNWIWKVLGYEREALDELTIDQVHSTYKSGAYTCRQLIEAYLERVKKLDQAGPKLNAITVVSPFALDEADYLDAFYKNNKSFIGPLHGEKHNAR